jgi:hypothetical protein
MKKVVGAWGRVFLGNNLPKSARTRIAANSHCRLPTAANLSLGRQRSSLRSGELCANPPLPACTDLPVPF